MCVVVKRQQHIVMDLTCRLRLTSPPPRPGADLPPGFRAGARRPPWRRSAAGFRAGAHHPTWRGSAAGRRPGLGSAPPGRRRRGSATRRARALEPPPPVCLSPPAGSTSASPCLLCSLPLPLHWCLGREGEKEIGMRGAVLCAPQGSYTKCCCCCVFLLCRPAVRRRSSSTTPEGRGCCCTF